MAEAEAVEIVEWICAQVDGHTPNKCCGHCHDGQPAFNFKFRGKHVRVCCNWAFNFTRQFSEEMIIDLDDLEAL